MDTISPLHTSVSRETAPAGNPRPVAPHRRRLLVGPLVVSVACLGLWAQPAQAAPEHATASIVRVEARQYSSGGSLERLLSTEPTAELTDAEAAQLAADFLSLEPGERDRALAHFGVASVPADAGRAAPQVVPVFIAAALIGCVASIGLSTYQAFKGGDPVEFIAGAVIGCIPVGGLGSALRPAIVAAIKAARPAVVVALKGLGLAANSALILALEGDR